MIKLFTSTTRCVAPINVPLAGDKAEVEMNNNEFDDGSCGMSLKGWRSLCKVLAVMIPLWAVAALVALHYAGVFND